MLHNAKPQTCSFTCVFGSEERLKNLIKIFQRNATAVIRELQFNVLVSYNATDNNLVSLFAIELLTKAKCIIPSLPVLVITGYGDIPMAVRALKAGASDFIEKPLERRPFLSAVKSMLKRSTQTHPLVGKVLSKTEMKVLRLILDGKSNKEMANLRHRSVRTIEDHRSRIMRKLGVDNLVDLVKQTAVVKLVELWEDR